MAIVSLILRLGEQCEIVLKFNMIVSLSNIHFIGCI